jgi:outer membrane protein assembly factor BamB
MKRSLTRIALGCLLLLAFAGCSAIPQTQRPTRLPVSALGACPDRPPAIPAAAAHTLYLRSSGNLYALNALSGKMLWCQQVKIIGDFPCPGRVVRHRRR